jgi:hypothetical protein
MGGHDQAHWLDRLVAGRPAARAERRDGLKFAVQVADLSDAVIQAIPTASPDQWDGWFSGPPPFTPAGAPAGEYAPAPPGHPVPLPGYS